MYKQQIKLFIKYFRFLKPYRKKQVIILVLSSLGVLLSLVNPYLSKLVVDRALMNKDLKTFIILGAIGITVFLLDNLLKAIAQYLKQSVQYRINFDLNKKLFTHLQSLPLDFFKSKSTGEHIYQLNFDIERVTEFIVIIPENIISIFPKLFFILAIVIYLNWQMAIFSIILAPAVYLPTYFFTRKMRKVLKNLFNNQESILKRLIETFSHAYLVKAFAKERKEINNYLMALLRNIKLKFKNIRLEITSGLLVNALHWGIIGITALFGGYQMINGRLSLGTLTAIMLYLTQLISLQNNLALFFQRISLGLISCQRLDDIFVVRPLDFNINSKNKKELQGKSIQFKKTSFFYQPKEYIIKDMDFRIEKGCCALVGASGCGKTTILNLILGLYAPKTGDIFIDDYNIKDLNGYFLREQIGIALQEPFLWDDTIENNIKYGNPKAAQEEVSEVSRLTGVNDLVRDLPLGYKAVIGENACKISEGQKQRIAIARAIIKKPKILILDEAMSSMDSASEQEIINNIKLLPINIIILVSHRLSTIINADLVYFIKNPQSIVIDHAQQFKEKDADFCRLFHEQMLERMEF